MNKPNHDPKWVVIGKIGRTHGLKGYLNLYVYDDWQEHYNNLHILQDSWQKIDYKIISSEKPKIKINGYDSPEQAKVFTNSFLAIPRSDMPEPKENEFYLHDIIGMQVINQQNQILGIVTDIHHYGAHHNLVIQNKKVFQIPMIDNVVITKNFSNKTITVNWDIENN